MLDPANATALAADMTALVEGQRYHFGGGSGAPMSYQAAIQVVEGDPLVRRALGAATSAPGVVDLTSGTFGSPGMAGDTNPFQPGGLVLAEFGMGRRGMEAAIRRLHIHPTEAILVPARSARWTPKSHVPYQVRLERQIATGRVHVWTVRPVDVVRDERAHDARMAIVRAYSALSAAQAEIDHDARAALWRYVASLDLPAAQPRPARPADVEPIEWGPWGAHASQNQTPAWFPGSGRGRPMEVWTIRGRRSASWRGREGAYDVVIRYSAYRHEYESPDGGRRYDEGVAETVLAATLVDGDDVLGQHTLAEGTSRNDYEAAIGEYHRAASAAPGLVAAALPDALRGVPELPGGHRLDVPKVLRETLNARLAGG